MKRYDYWQIFWWLYIGVIGCCAYHAWRWFT